jgi:hypothetical protein
VVWYIFQALLEDSFRLVYDAITLGTHFRVFRDIVTTSSSGV